VFTLFRRRPKSAPTVEFCESCAQVCTAQCRADSLLDSARTQALLLNHRR
jgi:hypothetical protein